MLNNNCIITLTEACFIQKHLAIKTIHAQEIIIGSRLGYEPAGLTVHHPPK